MRWSLVLMIFAVFTIFLGSCKEKKAKEPYTIIWKNNRAIALSVDRWTIDSLKISLENSEYPVLGDITSAGDRSVFTPVIPFQRGLTYHIFSGTEKLYSFTIPPDSHSTRPELIGTYPSCDTVPSNLLKMYLQFSEPMVEGRSSQYVQLFDAMTGDTVKNAFLDLQPELWNEDGTVLTLWLDPGRIKQDLIPNKKLGAVLTENKKYKLIVANGWKSKKGVETSNKTERSFTTIERDVIRPNPKPWRVDASRDTIIITTMEPLDWALLQNTISIENVAAKTIVNDCEQQIKLIPQSPLKPGDYSLIIQSQLEDLAGNNLNRLFETDVTDNSNKSSTQELYTLRLRIN